MPYEFFTVPAKDAQAASTELNQFCASHSVVAIDKQFVVDSDNSYWAFCVNWVNKGSSEKPRSARSNRVDYKEILSEADFRVFAQLRELRKDLAARDGVPIYNVFTNEQLATMVQLPMASKADLQKIPGIGKTRLEKYAAPFLQVLASINKDAQEKNDA